MRFFTAIVATLAVASGVAAVDVQKSVIITFPKEMSLELGDPDALMNRAMDEIKNARGQITHTFNLFR
jgi:hypothetical protein